MRVHNSIEEDPREQGLLVDEVRAALRSCLPGEARVAVIAGSGLGGFAAAVDVKHSVSYRDLPHVGASTVASHRGTLVHGQVGDTPIFLMNGRRHLYEGMGPARATILLRALLLEKGVRVLIVSNAAGGLNRCFEVGDLMLISDHVNWMFVNPLIGPNRSDWGLRFPDLSDLYSVRLRALAHEAGREAGVLLRDGVYLGGLGPSYETRAEVGMLRGVLGADAVGMSTVHEALVAAHMGREVLGISFISNLLTEPAKTTHDEVVENARKVEDKFCRLLVALIPRLGGQR